MFSVTLNLEAVEAAMSRYTGGQLGRRVVHGLRRGMDRANQVAMGQALKHRFTGKGPYPVGQHRLGVRSGLLRRSMRATKAELVSVPDLAVVSRIGSKVRYFGPHEFGSKARVNVRAHTRVPREIRVKKAGTRRTLKVRAATKSGGVRSISVRAHKRRLNIPERRPLRTALNELRSRAIYHKELTAAVIAALGARNAPAGE